MKSLEIPLRERALFSRIWVWTILTVAVAIILTAAYRLDRLSYSSFIQQVRSETYVELLEVRESFEAIVHSQSLVLRELATFIGDNPDITQEEFSIRAQSIRGVDDSMVSIAAAPDMVITLIYPVAGNEGALGLDYRTNAEQLPVVEEMMRTGGEMVTGPVNLAQGGTGLILRAPVYLPVANGISGTDAPADITRPWGIVSLVLDYERFLAKAGISEATVAYDLLIDVVSDTGTTDGAFSFGDMSLKDRDPVMLQFDFEFENWQLYATPKDGWPQTSPTQWYERILMAVIALALLLLVLYILWLSETRKRAETILHNGIEALADGFVMYDANDRLIVSNERYREIYNFPEGTLKYGTPFSEYVKSGVFGSEYLLNPADQEDWLERRRQSRRDGISLDFEQHLADGRVIKVSDRRMQDGSYVGLRVDVTELSRAKAAAEAASDAKTDFMGVLSHELRTPLTVILGVARLVNNARIFGASKTLLAAIESGDKSPNEIKAHLDDMFTQLSGMMDRMVRSGDHLLHLINEMLDVAKIESGSLTVERDVCEIEDIMDPVRQQLSTLSREKGLQFEVTQDAGTVFADKVRAQQILFNLVGNAIKFTDEGYVRLAVSAHPDKVVFEVRDSGSGISEAEFESIFDVFYQVDSTATRRAGGIGMGLAISRNLAELQGGSLTVESTLGKGSNFILTLPSSQVRHELEADAA